MSKVKFVPWADLHGELHEGELEVRGVTLRSSKCQADFKTIRVLWLHDEACDGLNWSEDWARWEKFVAAVRGLNLEDLL